MTHLQDVDELPIRGAHLVWVHDLVASTELEDGLVKLLVRLEVAILEELLALLVVCGQHQAREDGT